MAGKTTRRGYTVRTEGATDILMDRWGDPTFRVDAGHGAEAVKLIERAGYLNDVRRKYSAAAQVWARIEALPGFANAAEVA